MKTVKRTYYSKKLGQYVTKTYTYNNKYDYSHKSTKGYVLVNDKGTVNKKNVNNFKQAIKDSDKYSEAEKTTLINDLEAKISMRKGKTNKKLTTNGFLGTQETTKIERYLTNMGYSVEEFADELNIKTTDVLNEENWVKTDKGQEYRFGKQRWLVNFTYTGSVLIPI